MAEVTLTSAMRANLLSLQQTATLLGTTQFRLATGNKVNSALDNPSSYFAAQGLNSRASDLSALLDGMGQSVQTLKAADNAITSMTTLLQSAKAIAQTAKTQPAGDVEAVVTGSSVASMVGSTTLASAGYDATDTYSIQVGTGPVNTFTVTGSNTVQDLVDWANNINGVSASITNPGTASAKVVIKTTNAEDIDIVFTASDDATDVLGIDQTVAASGTAADYSAQITQYDDIRTQLDSLINDAGYRGINLLKGDSLVTQFNETNSSSSTISSSQDFTATGLGVTAASGNWNTVTDIDDAIQEISDAITTLKNEASKFGNGLAIIQARQDYTTNLVNVLKDGASALTIADKNEEGANLLALQTSQQLGIQALSLSSQANQSVLRLFS